MLQINHAIDGKLIIKIMLKNLQTYYEFETIFKNLPCENAT